MDKIITDDEYKEISDSTYREMQMLENNIRLLLAERDTLLSSADKKAFVEKLIETKKTLDTLWPTMTDQQKRLFVSNTIGKILVARGRIVSLEFRNNGRAN